MNAQILRKIVEQMMTPGKGILASDESTNSANKNLAKINVEGTLENRRRYRELFIGTANLGKYLNGIILFDETLRQADSNRIAFRDILKKENVLIGIKVDKGAKPLPFFPDETYTQGLDGLKERLEEYKSLGVKFAKWRSVIAIGKDIPTDEAIEINTMGLTAYAALCQEVGIVPMVEPEVLYKGEHSIKETERITKKVLKRLFYDLTRYKIDLEALVLKTGMVLAGKDSEEQSTPEEIANATVRALKESVPAKTGGIVFLSGGQSPKQATINFNEIAKKEPLPWPLEFCFLRAIEGPAGEVWQGKDENIKEARRVFITKLKENTAADRGNYNG